MGTVHVANVFLIYWNFLSAEVPTYKERSGIEPSRCYWIQWHLAVFIIMEVSTPISYCRGGVVLVWGVIISNLITQCSRRSSPSECGAWSLIIILTTNITSHIIHYSIPSQAERDEFISEQNLNLNQIQVLNVKIVLRLWTLSLVNGLGCH